MWIYHIHHLNKNIYFLNIKYVLISYFENTYVSHVRSTSIYKERDVMYFLVMKLCAHCFPRLQNIFKAMRVRQFSFFLLHLTGHSIHRN